jgi:hypothetical protein
MIRFHHVTTKENIAKMKKEENKKQAVPVMKQLARPVSKEELATVSGGPGSYVTEGTHFSDVDRLN